MDSTGPIYSKLRWEIVGKIMLYGRKVYSFFEKELSIHVLRNYNCDVLWLGILYDSPKLNVKKCLIDQIVLQSKGV